MERFLEMIFSLLPVFIEFEKNNMTSQPHSLVWLEGFLVPSVFQRWSVDKSSVNYCIVILGCIQDFGNGPGSRGRAGFLGLQNQ